MLKGFKEFILRGSAIDLAVGVVIGAAFTAVVNSLVTGLLDPLVSAIFGKPNLDEVGTFTINNAHFSIGIILTALLNLVLIALAVYFVIIVPMNRFREKYVSPAEEADAEELVVLREIRDALASRD